MELLAHFFFLWIRWLYVEIHKVNAVRKMFSIFYSFYKTANADFDWKMTYRPSHFPSLPIPFPSMVFWFFSVITTNKGKPEGSCCYHRRSCPVCLSFGWLLSCASDTTLKVVVTCLLWHGLLSPNDFCCTWQFSIVGCCLLSWCLVSSLPIIHEKMVVTNCVVFFFLKPLFSERKKNKHQKSPPKAVLDWLHFS